MLFKLPKDYGLQVIAHQMAPSAPKRRKLCAEFVQNKRQWGAHKKRLELKIRFSISLKVIRHKRSWFEQLGFATRQMVSTFVSFICNDLKICRNLRSNFVSGPSWRVAWMAGSKLTRNLPEMPKLTMILTWSPVKRQRISGWSFSWRISQIARWITSAKVPRSFVPFRKRRPELDSVMTSSQLAVSSLVVHKDI